MGFKRRKAIYQLMSSNGDGTGDYNLIGDYSGSPTIFYFGDNPNTPYNYGKAYIARLIFSLVDSGSLDSGAYGNNLALTNGIKLRLKDREGIILTEYFPEPIITNGGWAKSCHDVTIHSFGSGNEVMSARYTFAKAGQPIEVNTHRGERLELELNDDFTGLIQHLFYLQGMYKYYQ